MLQPCKICYNLPTGSWDIIHTINCHADTDTDGIPTKNQYVTLPLGGDNNTTRKSKNEKYNEQCLLDNPHTVMINKENYYQEYKGHTKWLSLISSYFDKNNFFGTTLLRAHAQYIYIVCAKYPKASLKALVRVDFTVFALSKHKQNSLLKSKQEKKWLSSQSCHFVKKLFFGIKLLHAHVLCVYIM